MFYDIDMIGMQWNCEFFSEIFINLFLFFLMKLIFLFLLCTCFCSTTINQHLYDSWLPRKMQILTPRYTFPNISIKSQMHVWFSSFWCSNVQNNVLDSVTKIHYDFIRLKKNLSISHVNLGYALSSRHGGKNMKSWFCG